MATRSAIGVTLLAGVRLIGAVGWDGAAVVDLAGVFGLAVAAAEFEEVAAVFGACAAGGTIAFWIADAPCHPPIMPIAAMAEMT
ncbi:MAG: hypothetical protein ACKVOJ_01725 [Sphingomonadaceae bacterium]